MQALIEERIPLLQRGLAVSLLAKGLELRSLRQTRHDTVHPVVVSLEKELAEARTQYSFAVEKAVADNVTCGAVYKLIRDHQEVRRKLALRYHKSQTLCPPVRPLYEEFTKLRKDLETALEKEGVILPWQLSAVAESTFDPESCARVDIAGTVLLSDGVSSRLCSPNAEENGDDFCDVCNEIIQRGAEYGVGDLRYHCLDCVGSLCVACYNLCQHAAKVMRLVLDGVSEAAMYDNVRSLVAAFTKINPHLFHLVVPESHNSWVRTRQEVQSGNILAQIDKVFEMYKNRPYLGFVLHGNVDTSYQPEDDATTSLSAQDPFLESPEFREIVKSVGGPQRWKVQWATYEEVGRCFAQIREGLLLGGRSRCNVGISMSIPALWHLTEVAIVRANCCAVGAHPTWSPADILSAFGMSGVELCVVDRKVLHTLMADRTPWPECIRSVHVIVWMDEPTHMPQPQDLQGSFDGLLSIGATLNIFPVWMWQSHKNTSRASSKSAKMEPQHSSSMVHNPSLPCCVVFTSGTGGGKPNGVQYSSQELLSETEGKHDLNIVDVGGLAPSWISDKRQNWGCMARGGRMGFYNPTMVTLFDAYFTFQPRPSDGMFPMQGESLLQYAASITQRVMEHFQGRIDDSVRAAARTHAVVVRHLYKHALGGRLAALAFGGAAVRKEMLSTLRQMLPCKVVESYGSTEGGSILLEGTPKSGVEVRLEERSDLGYVAPYGELCVKSREVRGRERWVVDPSAREALDARYTADGFLRTGDIARLRPDGKYELVDRISATIKLAHGKFCSPLRVEEAILGFDQATAAGLTQCFVTPDEDKMTLVAMLRFHGPPPTGEYALSMIFRACAAAQIPQDETPRKVVLDTCPEPWTSENGCLSASGKPSRRGLEARMRTLPVVETAAAAGATSTASPRVENVSDLSLRFLTHFGRSDADPMTPLRFLGLDSLSLFRAPRVLSDMVGAGGGCPEISRMSVPQMMSESALTLAEKVMMWQSSEPSIQIAAAKEESPGPLSKEVERSPYGGGHTIHIFEDRVKERVRQIVTSLKEKRPSEGAGDGILLTGATGYLGRNVLRQVLRHEVLREANIVCLTRSNATTRARDRVRQSLLDSICDSGDKELLTLRFEKNCSVVDCDLSQPFPESLQNELSHHSVAAILHCAATVKSWNLTDGLGALFDDNVTATLNLLTLRIPRFTYISTVSVCVDKLVTDSDNTPEGVWPSEIIAKNPNSVDAYAASKLLAEAALREVATEAETFDLLIVRPPLLTFPSDCTRDTDFNHDDWLVRLIDTCVRLELVPQIAENPILRPYIQISPVDCHAQLILRHLFLTKGAKIRIVYDTPHKVNLNSILGVLPERCQRVPPYAWAHAVRSVAPLCVTRYLPLVNNGFKMQMRSTRQQQKEGEKDAEECEEVLWKPQTLAYVARKGTL